MRSTFPCLKDRCFLSGTRFISLYSDRKLLLESLDYGISIFTLLLLFAVLIVTINCFSVKLSKAVQIFFTIAKLAIIAAIVIGGFVMMGQGYTENFNNAFAGSTSSFSAIALGFYSGLWSYDGW